MCVVVFELWAIRQGIAQKNSYQAQQSDIISAFNAVGVPSYPQNVRNPILDETNRVLQTVK